MLSSRLSLPTLIELCRVARHYLSAGLALQDLFRQQGNRGPASVRPVARRLAESLQEGQSLSSALKREARSFPPLFLAMCDVGESAGMLPEVFGELESYFLGQQKLRQSFLASIAWPVLQFVGAIFVLAGLILVLGLIPTAQGFDGQPYDPLGLGLSGPSGAAIFLGLVFGIFLGAVGLYLILTRLLRQRVWLDRVLLTVPALGGCLRALALYRFCFALRLTTETGMSIGKALRLSLRATSNEAFISSTPVVLGVIREGEALTQALSSTGLFPEDFLSVVAVGEESGRLAEVLQQQGEYQHGVAARRMAILASLAGGAIWLLVVGAFVTVILRMYLSYFRMLDSI